MTGAWRGYSGDTRATRVAKHQAEALKRIQFQSFRDRFFTSKANPATRQRFGRGAYALALGVGLIVGTVHYTRESFVIYLRYQALVDSYFYHQKSLQV